MKARKYYVASFKYGLSCTTTAYVEASNGERKEKHVPAVDIDEFDTKEDQQKFLEREWTYGHLYKMIAVTKKQVHQLSYCSKFWESLSPFYYVANGEDGRYKLVEKEDV